MAGKTFWSVTGGKRVKCGAQEYNGSELDRQGKAAWRARRIEATDRLAAERYKWERARARQAKEHARRVRQEAVLAEEHSAGVAKVRTLLQA